MAVPLMNEPRGFSEVEHEPTDLDRLLQKERSNPYEPKTQDECWRLAEIVARSGMYGFSGSPDAAYIVLMAGKDLGLSQSQALNGISVIKGKAAPAAMTLAAVCLNHPKLCEYFDPVEQTATSATWRTKRRGRPESRYTFTLDDARTAGLTPAKPDSGWTKWPSRMLSARAMAFLARDVYPDLTLGMYAAEELIAEPPTVPAELGEIAEWQAKAPIVEPPAPSKQEAKQEATKPVAPPDLLDPLPPPPPPALDWRAAMRSAETKQKAARIGSAAIKADPSIRAEAAAILKELGK